MGLFILSGCKFEHSSCTYSLTVNPTSTYTGNGSVIRGELYRELKSKGFIFGQENGDIKVNISTASSNDRVDQFLCRVDYSIVDFADVREGITLNQGSKRFRISEIKDSSGYWLDLEKMEHVCTKQINSHLKSVINQVGSCVRSDG